MVWSAHRLRTAEETFKKLQAFARRKRVAPHVLKVVLGSGEESIEFRNGSRIMFGARAAGFGRGFDEVDVVVYDEAQILADAALDDMIPATNQCRQDTGALMLFMGTPPKPDDPSEVFTGMREDALSGEDEDTGWIEFGADPSHTFTPKPAPLTEADWRQIAKANPSFPEDTPREAVLRMRKKLGHESFIREGAGIWGELRKNYAFGAGSWELCSVKDPGPHVDAIALAVSLDRLSASIGAAGAVQIDDAARMFVAAVDRREGTGWLVPEAWRIHQERGCPVVVSRSASDLVPALEAGGFVAGESLIIARAGDAQDACAQIFDRVQQQKLAHANHDELDTAVYGAHRREINGRWVWDRKNSTTDVSMLEAVTLAQWQAALVTPDYDVLDSIY
ncbi:MAG: terminase [Solimonas sp.]